MRKVCLIFLTNENFDCLPSFERAFKEAGFEVEAIRLPNVWISGLSRKYINQLKSTFSEKKSQGYSVIFSPQSTELFISEADFTITYSAYRDWFDPTRMRVIPHLWTPLRCPESVDHLIWAKKPELRIGFMGRFYSSSKSARLVLNAPKVIQQWILHGNYLRYPRLVATMNEIGASVTEISAFPRIETINALRNIENRPGNFKLDIAERSVFSGSEREINEYKDHIEKSTYVICPRGTENYSFRIYEALSRGRIPVIVDTDIVLPPEIDWERVAIRVPHRSLSQISDFILQDYESRTAGEFISRQERSLETMRDLGSMRWVEKLAEDFASRQSNLS